MKYNILFIVGFDIKPNRGGGVGRVTSTLAAEFKKIGYNVFFLALKEGSQEKSNGFDQFYIPDQKHLSSNKNVFYIKDIIVNNKIDIVINQTGIYKKQFTLIKNALPVNVKLFTVHHNCVNCLLDNYRHILLRNPKFNWFLKFVDFNITWRLLKFRNKIKYGHYFSNTIKYSDKLVLLAESFKDELKVYVKNFDKNKVVSIQNPCPFPILEAAEKYKENILLYVGRIESVQKQTELLIEIWTSLYKEFPDWQFDIVGDGSVKQKLEQEAKEKRLERINFHGYCDPESFYKKAKIFILPSSFEGYGMVLTEALAYGVVPIVFNCFDAINEIIYNEINGYIVTRNNIYEMITKIKYLMVNEKRRREMLIKGQSTIIKFSPEIISNKWLDLFTKNE